VFVVNKQDCDSCNTKNPIYKMDGGDSIYKFNKADLFYFISGNLENCQNGEKFKVVVFNPHNHKHHGPSLSPAVAPVHSPTPSPLWNSSAPSVAAIRNAPSPSRTAPTHSPAKSPAWNAPSPSWTAPTHSPTQSPASPTWNAPSPS